MEDDNNSLMKFKRMDEKINETPAKSSKEYEVNLFIKKMAYITMEFTLNRIIDFFLLRTKKVLYTN